MVARVRGQNGPFLPSISLSGFKPRLCGIEPDPTIYLSMSTSRLVCGIVAVIVGLLSALAVGVIGTRFFGTRFLGGGVGWKYLGIAFVGGAGLVFLTADRMGLLAPPYSEPTHYGLDGRARVPHNRRAS